MAETTNRLDPSQLAEIERLHRKASPAPWHWSTSCSFRRLSATADGDVLSAITQRSDGHPDIEGKQVNMDIIVALRNAIGPLIEEVKAARAAEGSGE